MEKRHTLKQLNNTIMTQLNNGKTIKIKIGKVNQPVVERITGEDFLKTAVFGEQYRQMLSMLNRYVKYREHKTSYSTFCPNNVFTFVGERGSGKTSCMTSVTELLTNGNLEKLTSYPELKNTEFATIDIIDPSYFDDEHNIVSMFVAQLFKSFRDKEVIGNKDKCNFDVRRSLADAFGKAQRSMKCLLDNKEYEFDDDIETLSDLSRAVDLKKDIFNLVNEYLRFVRKEKGVLVLSIDDIDLNVSEADTMAEQIRKYLVSPNIIILLAAKLDQLTTIKNLHYAKEYHYLLENKKLTYDTIEEMTGQFLTKFAPQDQRIYMPSSDFYLGSGIEIEDDNLYGASVGQSVPELIFNRTRYLFYNTKQTVSYIIPRNLRKMCQLFAMLWTMPACTKETQAANKEIFRNYLFNTWVNDNLDNNSRKYIERVIAGWRNEQLNRIALDVLSEKYANWFKEIINSQQNPLDKSLLKEELTSIIDKRNREYNFSVGDIMSLVNNLEIAFEAKEDKCFFFILKTIYSMALYESYDKLTDEMDVEGYDEDVKSPKQEMGLVLLYDPFDDEQVSQYHKLVGGRFYNYRLSSVMPTESINNRQVPRTDRIINMHNLIDLIKEAIVKWEKYNESSEEEKETQREDLKRTVRLVEFFMFCSSRDVNLRNIKSFADYDSLFRRSDNVYYSGRFNSVAWLFFDLGAFFYNMTCLRDCYKRFRPLGEEFYRLCRADKGYDEVVDDKPQRKYVSLLSTFRDLSLKYRQNGYNKYHAWQSWASIRNSEILFDLNQHILSKCKKEDSNRQYLAKYFETISDFSIKTYDRDEKDTFYNINFEFASLITDLLNDVQIDAQFNAIFSDDTLPAGTDESTLMIDVDKVLKGRKEKQNRKATVLKHLMEKQHDAFAGNENFVRAMFNGFDSYMTREEIRKVVNDINLFLISQHGETKRNAQTAVSSAES